MKDSYRILQNSAYTFFYDQKWPTGFHCPRCGHSQAYTIHTHTRSMPLYQCKYCRHQTTLTAGTIMEGSRTCLTKWRTALELVADQASVNAVRLSKIISVTYKTAWSILHKIRKAIRTLDEQRRMIGYVTGSIVFYGRPSFVYYRTAREHPLWISYAQEGQVRKDNCMNHNNGIYVKIKCMTESDLNGQRMAYEGEKRLFEAHLERHAVGVTLNRAEFRRDPVLYPLYQHAKQWINTTFRGIGAKYQQAYWDEFCFRLNYKHHDKPLIQLLASLCVGQNNEPTNTSLTSLAS